MESSEASQSTCIFCRIVAGEIPATLVYEDESCVAFRDITPQAPVHILTVPRVHVSNVAEASPTVLQQVMIAATAIAQQENLLSTGYRLVINCGPDAGQSVDHLHVHLLGGRALAWPPG